MSVPSPYRCVLIRHGQSVLNQQNRFGGWIDVPLSSQGHREAKQAAQLLSKHHFHFDVAYTSVLTRSIQSYNILSEYLNESWIPVFHTWRLNERHYGALQGRNKTEVVHQYGEHQVKIWRRSYDVPPPPIADDDERHPCKDRRYKNIPKKVLPKTECLKTVVSRISPLWDDVIT